MKKSELKKHLVEALTPDEAAKVEPKYKETYAAMIRGKGPLKLKKYDNPDKVVRGRVVNTIKNESLKIAEKLGKTAKIDDYIDDFRKSDAKQFRGKSQKKIDQMATAAFLNKEEQKLDEIDAMMEDAQEKSEKNYSNYFKKMDKSRLEEFVKAALMGPIEEEKFPDLNDDGKITKADVLIGRGVKLKEEEEDEKEFVAINAIIADLNDKVPQFKTIDTPDEYLALLDRIVKILIKESPSFVGSGRFITANVEFYNRRKDYNAKAKSQGETNVEVNEDTLDETDMADRILDKTLNKVQDGENLLHKLIKRLKTLPNTSAQQIISQLKLKMTPEEVEALEEGLRESFKSLSKDIDKQKGKTKEDGDNIAGYVANIKRKGGGKGPTAKQKKRMAEIILKELRG